MFILIAIGNSSVLLLKLPLLRTTRMEIYVNELNKIDDIDVLLSILCDKDSVVAEKNRELFPDRARISFRTPHGLTTRPALVQLHHLLRISAAIDKHEGTTIEFNERIIALLRINELLQSNNTLRLTDPQIKKLQTFKSNPTSILGNVKTEELQILHQFLNDILEKGQAK